MELMKTKQWNEIEVKGEKERVEIQQGVHVVLDKYDIISVVELTFLEDI